MWGAAGVGDGVPGPGPLATPPRFTPLLSSPCSLFSRLPGPTSLVSLVLPLTPLLPTSYSSAPLLWSPCSSLVAPLLLSSLPPAPLLCPCSLTAFNRRMRTSQPRASPAAMRHIRMRFSHASQPGARATREWASANHGPTTGHAPTTLDTLEGGLAGPVLGWWLSRPPWTSSLLPQAKHTRHPRVVWPGRAVFARAGAMSGRAGAVWPARARSSVSSPSAATRQGRRAGLLVAGLLLPGCCWPDGRLLLVRPAGVAWRAAGRACCWPAGRGRRAGMAAAHGHAGAHPLRSRRRRSVTARLAAPRRSGLKRCGWRGCVSSRLRLAPPASAVGNCSSLSCNVTKR